MRIEGTQPNKGISGENAGGAKASPKAGGKSFGAALEKAASALSRNANPPATPASGHSGPASPSKPAAPADGAATTPADSLEMIRFRMKTGYYNSKSLDDALTDKLTGYFDDLT